MSRVLSWLGAVPKWIFGAVGAVLAAIGVVVYIDGLRKRNKQLADDLSSKEAMLTAEVNQRLRAENELKAVGAARDKWRTTSEFLNNNLHKFKDETTKAAEEFDAKHGTELVKSLNELLGHTDDEDEPEA